MENIVKKNDFIDIEFTGRANEEVFDTTDINEAKKMGIETEVKPIIISIGNGMLLKGFDEDLIDKEIGKKYSLKLSPDNAFGKRNPSMIRVIPIKIFKEKDIYPYPGMTVQLDNHVARILSVSGGRITVDFNNPIAGKDVEYEYKILKKIEDNNDKVNSLQDFFFRTRFEFSIEEKKVIFKKNEIKAFIDIFKDRFKLMTGLDFVVEEKENPNKNELNTSIKPDELNNKENEVNEVIKESIPKENSKDKKKIDKQKTLI
ncbi:MAG: peptidylprolyl isomerase [Candidatus Pacearchaeota archaeon]|jgi:FKBP-type peptidyl-prolyl cis-trans isomerase SlyD